MTPDIEYLERDSEQYRKLFAAGDGQVSVTAGRTSNELTVFHNAVDTLLFDHELNDHPTKVTLATVHPDFPDAVRVWIGVLNTVETEGPETRVRLLDGREVFFYDTIAVLLEPEKR